MVNTINPGTFGHMVIGEAAVAEEKVIAEKQVLVFGPLVTGLPADPALAAKVVGELEAKTLAELEASLAEVPEAIDALMEQEFAREGGPRKGALRLFLEAEGKQTSPRQAIVARLEDALG